MQITLTNAEVLEMAAMLRAVKNLSLELDEPTRAETKERQKFLYALTKNRRLFDAYKKDVEGGMEDYQEARQKIIDDFAKKDKDGKPVRQMTDNGQSIITECSDPVAQDDALKSLQDEHAITDYLEMEIEVDAHVVSDSNVMWGILPNWAFGPLLPMMEPETNKEGKKDEVQPAEGAGANSDGRDGSGEE